MRIGILLPGFSSSEDDPAIPVQQILVREMAKDEDVRVLALRYPHRRDCYTVHGATVHSLGYGQARGLRRLALWLDALWTLRRLHREKPFDMLHAMWADETGLIAAWAGRWLGVPVVVSIAGGELARLDDIRYGLQRGAFSRWIVGQALRGADRVVVACEYVRGLIDTCGYAIPEGKIAKIVLGVDVEALTPSGLYPHPPAPSPLRRGGERPHPLTPSPRMERGNSSTHRLVHAGSLVGVKDQATLLRAVARLGDKVTLDIAGTGPEEGRLRALAAELGIEDRVRFFGAVQFQDMAEFYRGAALNLLTSRHEGLGMVTLEAAACGVPTISTAVGLLPDVPEMGVSVPVGDDAALAQLIQELLDDEERRAALAKSAYQTVRERFTIQRTVKQFQGLYRIILRDPSDT